MVVGLFVITSIPTVTGVCQAVSAQKNRDRRLKDEQRMRKFNIIIQCYPEPEPAHQTIQHGRVVVRDGKVWVGTPVAAEVNNDGYVSECMLVEYPDPKRVPTALGLVSQVQDNPPLLNWIYVDRGTMELKYGNKTASIDHHVGSWDWTDDEHYLTVEERDGSPGEAFIAVEIASQGQWQLFYDMEGDGLQHHVPCDWAKKHVRMCRKLVVDDE